MYASFETRVSGEGVPEWFKTGKESVETTHFVYSGNNLYVYPENKFYKLSIVEDSVLLFEDQEACDECCIFQQTFERHFQKTRHKNLQFFWDEHGSYRTYWLTSPKLEDIHLTVNVKPLQL